MNKSNLGNKLFKFQNKLGSLLIIADFFYWNTRERIFGYLNFALARVSIDGGTFKDACHLFTVDFTLHRNRLLSQRRSTVTTVDTRVLFLFSLSFSRDITPRLDGGENVTWNYASSFPRVSERIAGVIVVSRYFDEIELPSTTNR